MFSLGLGKVGGTVRAANFDESGADWLGKVGDTEGDAYAESTGDTSLWSIADVLSGDKDLALFLVSDERSRIAALAYLAHGDGGEGGAVLDLLVDSPARSSFPSSLSKSLNDLFFDRNFLEKRAFASDLLVMEALN